MQQGLGLSARIVRSVNGMFRRLQTLTLGRERPTGQTQTPQFLASVRGFACTHCGRRTLAIRKTNLHDR